MSSKPSTPFAGLKLAEGKGKKLDLSGLDEVADEALDVDDDAVVEFSKSQGYPTRDAGASVAGKAQKKRKRGRKKSIRKRDTQLNTRVDQTTYEAFNWFFETEELTQARVIEAALSALCRERMTRDEAVPPGYPFD